jgi:hypothetical protein
VYWPFCVYLGYCFVLLVFEITFCRVRLWPYMFDFRIALPNVLILMHLYLSLNV